jgi:hypothetical protein
MTGVTSGAGTAFPSGAPVFTPVVFSGVRVTRSLVLRRGTLGSVASLLAATLYQGNPDRNHKLWNIVLTERDILHKQALLECCYIFDRIYPIELEIKDTTDTDRSASYHDLNLEIESEGWLRTKIYDKKDDFNFPIVTRTPLKTTGVNTGAPEGKAVPAPLVTPVMLI